MLDHVDKVLFHLPGFLLRRGRATLLDHQLIETQLLRGSLEDALLDRVVCHETVHKNLLLLADAVCSVHGLEVCLRIPVTVEQDDDIGARQVDAQTTGACCKQEQELVAVWAVVFIDRSNAVFMDRAAVNPAVCILAEEAVVFENIKHAAHLAENQHTRAALLHLAQQLVEDVHLAAVVHQVLVRRVRRPRLSAIK